MKIFIVVLVVCALLAVEVSSAGSSCVNSNCRAFYGDCNCDPGCCQRGDCCLDFETYCPNQCTPYITEGTPFVVPQKPLAQQTVALVGHLVDDGASAGVLYWDCLSNGARIQQTPYLPNGQDTILARCVFPTEGSYCITYCYDDTTAGYNSGTCAHMTQSPGSLCSKKRHVVTGAVTVSVFAGVAGDPYFYGFDGQIQKFNGRIGETYNYISSPFLQLNGLVSPGFAAMGKSHLQSITRSVGVMWEGKGLLQYECDRRGKTTVTMLQAGEMVQLDESQDLDIEEANGVIQWRPSDRSVRYSPHLAAHNVTAALELKTARYTLQIFSVELFTEVPFEGEDVNAIAHRTYHFIDLALHRHDSSECLEGAWGRSTCGHSSSEMFDEEIYNTHRDLFGTDFALNMYPSN